MRDVLKKTSFVAFSICRLLFNIIKAAMAGKGKPMVETREDIVMRDIGAERDEREKEEKTMEATLGYRRFIPKRVPNLQEIVEFYTERVGLTAEAETGYRRYGKFLVKETFEGDSSLTDLLTGYIEKTASLKY